MENPHAYLKGKTLEEDIRTLLQHSRSSVSEKEFADEELDKLMAALRSRHPMLTNREVSLPVQDVEALVNRLGLTEEDLRNTSEKLNIFKGMLDLSSRRYGGGLEAQEDYLINGIMRKISAKRGRHE